MRSNTENTSVITPDNLLLLCDICCFRTKADQKKQMQEEI